MYFRVSWDQGDWWASGASCGELFIFLLLDGARWGESQGTKREYPVGVNSTFMEAPFLPWKLMKKAFMEFAGRFRGMYYLVQWNLFLTSMEANPTSMGFFLTSMVPRKPPRE